MCKGAYVMSIIQGAILGLVQGLGEFLPISSSGHVLLASMLMGVEFNDTYKILVILLHVGTLIPALIVFWNDWIDMILHPIRNKTLLLLFLASLPSLALYVIFDLDMFDTGWFLGPSFLFTALLLLLTDILASRSADPERNMRIPNALAMGIMQGFALLPGVSRSGATIFGAVASNVRKDTAAKFSFMMSAVAIVASLLVEGKDALEDHLFDKLELAPTLVGIIIAAVVGYLSIRFMLKIITRYPLSWFALYLAVLGIIILVVQLTASPLFPAFRIPEGMHLIRLGH